MFYRFLCTTNSLNIDDINKYAKKCRNYLFRTVHVNYRIYLFLL